MGGRSSMPDWDLGSDLGSDLGQVNSSKVI